MANHVDGMSFEQRRAFGEVLTTYDSRANGDNQLFGEVHWDSQSVAPSHGIGETDKLLPRRRSTVTHDIRAEMKRKRSSIVAFGRQTAKKVFILWHKAQKGRNDSGYQSIVPSSTPEVEVAKPDQTSNEGLHWQGPVVEDQRSIATAIDNEDHTGLLLLRHRRPSPWPSPRSRSDDSVSDISGMIDRISEVYEANPFEVEHVEHNRYWEASPPPYTLEDKTPPDWSLSSGAGVHMFDPDLLSRRLGVTQREGQGDDGARQARFDASYGYQTSRGAQVFASERYRASALARVQRTSVPTEGQAGPPTWQRSSSAERLEESLSDGIFSSPPRGGLSQMAATNANHS